MALKNIKFNNGLKLRRYKNGTSSNQKGQKLNLMKATRV